jgi:nucleotide sugar dehydrogenase
VGGVGDFKLKIESKSITIGIVGLGYVGLPTAISFFNSGFNIWGIDKSEDVVSKIWNQKNPTGDPSIDNKIPSPKEKNWIVTTSFSESVPNCDVIIVTVPTPVNSMMGMEPKFVVEAGRNIFSNIQKGSGKIVVLESTVYPGSTMELWAPIIEEFDLTIGSDIWIAYCPERHNPGDLQNNISTVSRVIGCSDQFIGESLVYLYSELTSGQVKYVGDIAVAESSKLVENIQRDINIALVNELATILPELGVDVEDVLDAASTKWNFHRFKPGIGVGGHCIPVDPYFIIDQAKFQGLRANLVSSAREMNESMPSFTFSQIQSIITENYPNLVGEPRILILGCSYKPNIGDVRGSPSFELYRLLEENGFETICFDPHVSQIDAPNGLMLKNEIAGIAEIDLVVLATAHEEVLDINWLEMKAKMNKPIIYDGRRVLDLKSMEGDGWVTYAVGRPFNS